MPACRRCDRGSPHRHVGAAAAFGSGLAPSGARAAWADQDCWRVLHRALAIAGSLRATAVMTTLCACLCPASASRRLPGPRCGATPQARLGTERFEAPGGRRRWPASGASARCRARRARALREQRPGLRVEYHEPGDRLGIEPVRLGAGARLAAKALICAGGNCRVPVPALSKLARSSRSWPPVASKQTIHRKPPPCASIMEASRQARFQRRERIRPASNNWRGSRSPRQCRPGSFSVSERYLRRRKSRLAAARQRKRE